MKKYQILTVVHSYFSTRIVPDAVVYDNLKDAIKQVHRLVETFTANGEEVIYRGKLANTNEVFNIYQKIDGEEYCDVYIYELEAR